MLSVIQPHTFRPLIQAATLLSTYPNGRIWSALTLQSSACFYQNQSHGEGSEGECPCVVVSGTYFLRNPPSLLLSAINQTKCPHSYKEKPLNNLVTELPSHALVKGRWHINWELLVAFTRAT
jgi:hypothetical protein